MRLARSRQAFPWRITLVLAVALCLPALTSWAWFNWELPPLQRYYLRAYWDSSETATEPGGVVEVQMLEMTAHGRKSEWPINSDVTDDPFGNSPAVLSFQALSQGWTGLEQSPPYAVGSTVLEGVLRRDFYEGQSLRQVVREPALYGCLAVLLTMLLAWRMRDDIGSEWRDVWRVVWEPESEWDSGWNLPSNEGTFLTRIRIRVAQALGGLNPAYDWFLSLMVRRHVSALPRPADSLTSRCADSSSLREGYPESSTAPNVSEPASISQLDAGPSQHLVFPGSSLSYVPSKDADVWHESEWIE
jgi:hypothetical protein